MTPSIVSTSSLAAGNGQPDADRDGGFWMSAGMRGLSDLGLGLVVVLFAATALSEDGRSTSRAICY